MRNIKRYNSGPLEASRDHGLSLGEVEYCGEHWSELLSTGLQDSSRYARVVGSSTGVQGGADGSIDAQVWIRIGSN